MPFPNTFSKLSWVKKFTVESPLTELILPNILSSPDIIVLPEILVIPLILVLPSTDRLLTLISPVLSRFLSNLYYQ